MSRAFGGKFIDINGKDTRICSELSSVQSMFIEADIAMERKKLEARKKFAILLRIGPPAFIICNY